ncbi:hypothetical protein DYB30_002323, partial [Aphanomyces astaci]
GGSSRWDKEASEFWKQMPSKEKPATSRCGRAYVAAGVTLLAGVGWWCVGTFGATPALSTEDNVRANCTTLAVQSKWHQDMCQKVCPNNEFNEACMSGCYFGTLTITKGVCANRTLDAPLWTSCEFQADCAGACVEYASVRPIPAKRNACEGGCNSVVPSACKRAVDIFDRARKEPIYLADDAIYSKDHFLVPNHYVNYVESVLIPQGLISDRVEKLAQDIRAAYEGQTIHLLCVLKGGSAFFHALIDKLRLFHKYNTCDYVPFTFDFIKVKSYDGLHSTGNVQVSGADLTKFKGKHLLLVEDIIDTGKTMAKLVPYLQESDPASVKVASLLEKRNVESCGFLGDFVGFSIPDKFVIGCCLDYNEIFRDLDHICIINDAGIAKWANH